MSSTIRTAKFKPPTSGFEAFEGRALEHHRCFRRSCRKTSSTELLMLSSSTTRRSHYHATTPASHVLSELELLYLVRLRNVTIPFIETPNIPNCFVEYFINIYPFLRRSLDLAFHNWKEVVRIDRKYACFQKKKCIWLELRWQLVKQNFPRNFFFIPHALNTSPLRGD